VSAGGGGGGQIAKDALGNDIKASEWLKTHPAGDRNLSQGLKVCKLDITGKEENLFCATVSIANKIRRPLTQMGDFCCYTPLVLAGGCT